MKKLIYILLFLPLLSYGQDFKLLLSQGKIVKFSTESITPILDSAEIGNLNDSTIRLYFNTSVNISSSGWTVDSNTVSISINSVINSGTSTPRFILNQPMLSTDTLEVSYSGAGTTQSTTGVALAALTDSSVNNNITVGVTPVVWSNLTNATAVGNDLTTTANNGGGNDTRVISSGNEGYAEQTIEDLSTNTQNVYGLSAGNSFETWNNIDYGIYTVDGDNDIFCVENGSLVQTINTTVQVGTVFRVRKEDQGATMDIVYEYDLTGSGSFTEAHRTTSITDVDMYVKGACVLPSQEISNANRSAIE